MPQLRPHRTIAVLALVGACTVAAIGCGDDGPPPLGTAKPAPAAAYPSPPANAAPRRSGKQVPAGYTTRLIGMSPKDAAARIQRDGYLIRISLYNGKRFAVTADRDMGRITLTVVKDRVATATVG